jgi:DNA polymerase-3 subunit delta
MELTYKSDAPAGLWKPALLSVYIFFGEEDRLKDEAVTALTDHLVPPDWRDFDLEAMEAGSADAGAILAAAGQIPFGAERRLVIVKGMEQWRDRNRQAEAERLAEGVARLPSSACLALVVAAEDDEARRKTAITAKLDNAVKKAGALVAFRALKGEGLAAWVSARAQQEGKGIEAAACQLLVETVGSEMLLLEQEIRKLAAYVGDRSAITARDVGLVVASTPEDVMFTTVDAITRRQTDRALTLLSELHRYDPKPQAVAGKLLSLLGRQYRMLWQAKFLAERRVNPRDVRALPPDMAAELPGEANIASLAFKAPDLFAMAKGLSWADLTRAMELLLLCDLANKGGVTEETTLFGADVVRNLQLLTLSLTNSGSAPAVPTRPTR